MAASTENMQGNVSKSQWLILKLLTENCQPVLAEDEDHGITGSKTVMAPRTAKSRYFSVNLTNLYCSTRPTAKHCTQQVGLDHVWKQDDLLI